jgi:hypothetical protein
MHCRFSTRSMFFILIPGEIRHCSSWTDPNTNKSGNLSAARIQILAGRDVFSRNSRHGLYWRSGRKHFPFSGMGEDGAVIPWREAKTASGPRKSDASRTLVSTHRFSVLFPAKPSRDMGCRGYRVRVPSEDPVSKFRRRRVAVSARRYAVAAGFKTASAN